MVSLTHKTTAMLALLVSLLAACASAATLAPAIPAATSLPATPTAPAGHQYAIKDVTIVDVASEKVTSDQTVLITGERIDRVGAQGELAIPPETQVVDGHGLYLIPGLVDAHVHYQDAPVFGRVMIANGVLLVRDMSMPNEYILPLRDELNRGETLGPEMVATGAMLDGSPPVIPDTAIGIATPEEGRAAVRSQAAAGVDMIKVYSKLEKDVFLAIVDEAGKAGLKVVGHVPENVYLEDAAAAGLKSIEHWNGFQKVIAKLLGEPVEFTYTYEGAGAEYLLRLDEVDPGALQAFYVRLRESGVTVDPTVVTYKVFPNVDALEPANIPNGEYISPVVLGTWKSTWAGQTEFPDPFWQGWAEMVKQMNAAGIPLVVGTDLLVAGVLPGFAVHEEMAIWQEAGIPAPDVLRAATITPAQLMGLDKRLGSVQAGKAATLVLLRANPLEDIRKAAQIEAVFLRGRYFSREDLDRLLAEARDLAKKSTP